MSVKWDFNFNPIKDPLELVMWIVIGYGIYKVFTLANSSVKNPFAEDGFVAGLGQMVIDGVSNTAEAIGNSLPDSVTNGYATDTQLDNIDDPTVSMGSGMLQALNGAM